LRVLVADEVVALVGQGRIEQGVDELVGIGALGPADHAPHRGVPLVAAVPDQRGLSLALQRLDVNVEAELAPLLGDQLRGLVGLRQRCLRPGIEVDLADLLRCVLRECLGRDGSGGSRADQCPSFHEASFMRARVYRFSGILSPRLSLSVLPSYSVRNTPRCCNSGTTWVQKSSNGLG